MSDTIYTITKNEYPETLRNTPEVPDLLYVRGSLQRNPAQKYLCVIGSRRYSHYGRDAVNKLFDGLRGFPISIVSGLAIGIDSIAHEAALATGLHCVAFPGSTLDWETIHPSSHVGLAKKIVAHGGALMSAWPIGYAMGKWAFPTRNRFMAGISHATLIIEAAEGSGSLITAEHALTLGRDVIVVPGSIFGSLSYGPHSLIREGAHIVTSAADILEELGFDPSCMQAARTDDILRSLDPQSRQVFDCISIGGMTVDDVVQELGMPVPEVLQRLSLLELQKLIHVGVDGIRLR